MTSESARTVVRYWLSHGHPVAFAAVACRLAVDGSPFLGLLVLSMAAGHVVWWLRFGDVLFPTHDE